MMENIPILATILWNQIDFKSITMYSNALQTIYHRLVADLFMNIREGLNYEQKKMQFCQSMRN